MQVEPGIYRTRQGSLAEVYFQVWDGTWYGKVNDEARIWLPSGEEYAEDMSIDLKERIGELD